VLNTTVNFVLSSDVLKQKKKEKNLKKSNKVCKLCRWLLFQVILPIIQKCLKGRTARAVIDTPLYELQAEYSLNEELLLEWNYEL